MIQSPHTLKPFCQTPKTWRFGRTNLGLHSHLPPCETIDDGRLSNLRYSWPTNPTTTWEWKKNSNLFLPATSPLGNAGVFICSSFGFCVQDIWKWPFYVLHLLLGTLPRSNSLERQNHLRPTRWGSQSSAAGWSSSMHPEPTNQMSHKKKTALLSMKS